MAKAECVNGCSHAVYCDCVKGEEPPEAEIKEVRGNVLGIPVPGCHEDVRLFRDDKLTDTDRLLVLTARVGNK
jgi:hypothetical protein